LTGGAIIDDPGADRSYRALLAAVPGFVCRFRPDGSIDVTTAVDADAPLVAELRNRWDLFGPVALGDRDFVTVTMNLSHEGVERWLVSRAVAERDEQGRIEAVVVVTTDDLSHRPDMLTGLYGELVLDEVLASRLSEVEALGPAVSVALIDLDQFGKVNLEHNHRIGDLVLTATAQAIVRCLREHDQAFRVGETDFAVVFGGAVSHDVTLGVAARIQAAVGAATEPLLGRRITTAVGLASADEWIEVAELRSRVSQAAVFARETGENQVAAYEPDMVQSATADRRRLDALRDAIEGGRLIVAFQPVVDLESLEIVGAESLVCWDHPNVGLLLPSEFIPLAESTGMITDITRHVLDTSVTMLADHQRAHPGAAFSLSVNITAADLADPGFVGLVAGVLDESGVDRSSVCLELTETAVLADTDEAIGVLAELRELGVSIALDDFGTGYASLSLLRQLPVNRVKIDQSFVSGLPLQADAAVVRLVMGLASELDLDVVAEGIETIDQAEMLAALGCRLGQGFLYSRPIVVDRLDHLVIDPVSEPG